jgi:hypothetical protein
MLNPIEIQEYFLYMLTGMDLGPIKAYLIESKKAHSFGLMFNRPSRKKCGKIPTLK